MHKLLIIKTNKSEGNTLCLDKLRHAWSNYHVFHSYSDIYSHIQEKIFHAFCSIVRLRVKYLGEVHDFHVHQDTRYIISSMYAGIEYYGMKTLEKTAGHFP